MGGGAASTAPRLQLLVVVWERRVAIQQLIDTLAGELQPLKGNRFETLKGDRAGYYSIRINDQWRITFRIQMNRALGVTIEDYH